MDDDEEGLPLAEVMTRETGNVEVHPEAVNTTTMTTSDTTSNAMTSTSPSTSPSAAPMKTTTTSLISTTTTSIDPPNDSQVHTAWFANRANLAYWSKGRQVICRLGIKEEVGIS